MSDKIPIAIIGGGVIGCAVALELSGSRGGIFLFEKNPGITRGENQSSRNSGVIHSGIYYDQETRPEKASHCVKGNSLLYEFCDRHQVPALKTGKLIVATGAEEENTLDLYLERAKENGVPGVEKISGQMVKEVEPNVRVGSALMVPSAGIVDPTTLVYRLHTLAQQGGVQFMVGTEVIGLRGEPHATHLTLSYRDGATDRVEARAVINAAGVHADRLAKLLNINSPYELDPIRGDSYKFYGHKRPQLRLAGKNIYPTPEAVMTPSGRHFTVGIHLTPTFRDLSPPFCAGSTVTVGPQLVAVEDRDDTLGDWSPPGGFVEKIQPFFPGLREEDLLWHQAGLQARLKEHPDFVIEADRTYPHFINLLGIDSPGLTASLSIARRVAKIVDRLGVT